MHSKKHMNKITHLRLESDEELAPEDQDYARGSHISKTKNQIIMRDYSVNLSAPKAKGDFFVTDIGSILCGIEPHVALIIAHCFAEHSYYSLIFV